MNRLTAPVGTFTEFSDWNRFPLPDSFRGCVDHSVGLFAPTARGDAWPAYIEQLAQSPFTDIALGRLEPEDLGLGAALTQLRHGAPRLRPWLEAPLPADPEVLLNFCSRHPQCALQLRVQLGGRDCAQIGQQLEALCETVEQLHNGGVTLGLILQDASGALPSQLEACIGFAQHFAIERVTLCDQQARLTPMGVRNLLNHLLNRFPDLSSNGPALAFKANDKHGLALANSMAAIANGIHFIHGTILAPAQQDGPLALTQLLDHYDLPQARQASHYARLIGHLTGLPSAAAPSSAYIPDGHSQPSFEVPQLPLQTARDNGNGPRFIFKVSADDWHVQLLIEWGGQLLDLGERVHHYVLLLLAREYCQQQQARQELNSAVAPDPMSLGWVEREHLHKMIGDSQSQLNVKLFRAIKQINCALSSAGLGHFKAVLTRVGSVRFACADFSIYKDSTLEHDVRAWTPLDVQLPAAGAQPPQGAHFPVLPIPQ